MKKNKFNLTVRECEILPLIVQGLNNAQIAKKLYITTHTSKAHVSAILKKLGVTNRVLAAIVAIRENLA